MTVWSKRARHSRFSVKSSVAKQDIDLGLAILSVIRTGRPLTTVEIAAWCGCSPQAILQIEQRAIAKLRKRLAEMEALGEVDLEGRLKKFSGVCRRNQQKQQKDKYGKH